MESFLCPFFKIHKKLKSSKNSQLFLKNNKKIRIPPSEIAKNKEIICSIICI